MKDNQVAKVHYWDSSSNRSGRVPDRQHLPFLVFAFVFLSVCAGWSLDPKAYTDSLAETQASFHFSTTAPTPRVPLGQNPTNLTTITFDAGNSSLYRSINGTESVLVSTFTPYNAFWQTARTGQPLTLHTGSGAGYDIFPWVSAGSDLKDYFATNYAATLTTGNVDLRISQTLGMPDRTSEARVLAFFWAPITLVLRPAYSANITTQINYSGLATYGDTSYQANAPPVGTDGFKWQDYNYSYYTGTTGFDDFMTNNEASTKMPWTAMGYTYNWDYNQGGVASYVGTTEFVVSAGATVVFDRFVDNANLFSYLVPEPGSVFLMLFGAGAVCFVRLRRTHLKVIRTAPETRGPGRE
ncbi:MAG: PEP-CTERM sorting domain-containing protein [Verrucomicrobiota bacterium]